VRRRHGVCGRRRKREEESKCNKHMVCGCLLKEVELVFKERGIGKL
jgi:hypothetical protein